MSSEPNNKRRKMNNKRFFGGNKSRNFLEPGIKGFLATCNFREKDCVRESYNLLNEFADQTPTNDENLNEEAAAIDANEETPAANNDSGNVDNSESDTEEEDIATELQNQIASINAKRKNPNRFQQVDTKVPNCIFIKTTAAVDPNELGVRIIRDIVTNQKRRTRFLLRLVPVDVVCKANIEDIKNAAGKMFDKIFLNTEPTTFAIVMNKRFNNDIDRMGIITELANMISFKNSKHKVDLKHAQQTVVVEVIKGLCCISVLPNYNEYKKYNVFELTKDYKTGGKGEATAADSEPKGTEVVEAPKNVVEAPVEAAEASKEAVEASAEASATIETGAGNQEAAATE